MVRSELGKLFGRLLEFLNELSDESIANAEFIEQLANIDDLDKLFGQLVQLLAKTTSIDRNNAEEVSTFLAEVHRILTTLEWHVSEVSDVNVKLFRQYVGKMG